VDEFFCAASKGDGSLSFYLSYKTDEHHFKNMDLADKTKMLLLFKKDFAGWGNVWNGLFENAENPFYANPDLLYANKPNLASVAQSYHAG